MSRPWSASSLICGVTAVLAALWLAAAVLTGPDGPAAAALDPGRPGSIGAWWGTALLVLALALSLPQARLLALAPAALLAGEVGEVHIHAARLLAAASGLEQYLAEVKALAALALGAVVYAAATCSRHDCCSFAARSAFLAAGLASVLFDSAQRSGAGLPWLAAAEEWSELVVYSVVVTLALAATIKSLSGTNVMLRPRLEAFGGASGSAELNNTSQYGTLLRRRHGRGRRRRV